MDKIEAYNRWHNPNHGFELQPDVNSAGRATTENGILYQAEFLMLQSILGTLDSMDESRFYRTVQAIEVEPGLYCRGRQDKAEDYTTRRTISQDNIDGVVFGGLLYGNQQYADEVASYGIKHFGKFNNVAPRKVYPFNPGNYFSWLSAVNNILAYLFLPIFIINIIIACCKKRQETSSKKLYLLSLYTLRNKNKILNIIFRIFSARMVQQYGKEYISELYKIYYPAEHPLNFFAQGIKYESGTFSK